jgi:hypothetical protein
MSRLRSRAGRARPTHDAPVTTPSPPLVADAVELAHRVSGPIDVSLFWSRRTNRLLLQVIDWAEDEDFTLEVQPAEALQAFTHPFAYLPARQPTPT